MTLDLVREGSVPWLSLQPGRPSKWSDSDSIGTTSGAGTSVQILPSIMDRSVIFAIGTISIIDPAWQAGTGRVVDLWLALQSGTGSTATFRPASLLSRTRMRARRSTLDSPATMIAKIRAGLGLNVSETARALGVERPTVYAWISDRTRPQRDHLIRLQRLVGIAARWADISGHSVGSLVRVPDSHGIALVDLLANEPLPEESIESRLQELAGVASAHATTSSRNVRDTAQRLGVRVSTSTSTQREIDWLTRRSLGPED